MRVTGSKSVVRGPSVERLEFAAQIQLSNLRQIPPGCVPRVALPCPKTLSSYYPHTVSIEAAAKDCFLVPLLPAGRMWSQDLDNLQRDRPESQQIISLKSVSLHDAARQL